MRTIDVRLDYAPSEKQARAHRSPARYVLYGGAMGGGKSVWLCASIIRACMKWPGSRWYLSRKESVALKRTTLITFADLLPAELISQHRKSDQVYSLHGGSEIWYGGLGEQADKEKIKSMEISGFGIDEASEVDEAHFLMLASRLRLKVPGVRYKGLLASNPEAGWVRNRFIDRNLKDHEFIPALPRDNPHLADGYEERLRELYSPEWARAYLDGDWDAFAGSNYVLAYADVNAAANRVIKYSGNTRCIGVDVARYGDDETVLIPREGPNALEMETYRGLDTIEIAGRVIDMERRYPGAAINIDAGYNPGVIDVCRQSRVYVNEVHFGSKAQDPEKFSNWASEALAGTLAARFRDGDISIPDDQELRSQLTARQYRYTVKGQIKIESKDDMKKRGLHSPDRADALMLAFAPINEWRTVPI